MTPDPDQAPQGDTVQLPIYQPPPAGRKKAVPWVIAASVLLGLSCWGGFIAVNDDEPSRPSAGNSPTQAGPSAAAPSGDATATTDSNVLQQLPTPTRSTPTTSAARPSPSSARPNPTATHSTTPRPAPTSSRPKPPPAPTTDPRFGTCKEANNAGYGPYYRGVDPEYAWYIDRNKDGVVCD
ncbi:excalibur calcium-binding domain-containing protein [Micromonospora sp. NPDC051006]|uniref:excalibur calcium-binding domain-containing protein n=1 Tax=Micromonospora sp. NPDC051006 TaxID=3364283 RepID=UPI0037B47E13